MSAGTKPKACFVCDKDSDRSCPCEMGRRYCSRECQRVDWQERDHQSVCSQTKTPEKASGKSTGTATQAESSTADKTSVKDGKSGDSSVSNATGTETKAITTTDKENTSTDKADDKQTGSADKSETSTEEEDAKKGGDSAKETPSPDAKEDTDSQPDGQSTAADSKKDSDITTQTEAKSATTEKNNDANQADTKDDTKSDSVIESGNTKSTSESATQGTPEETTAAASKDGDGKNEATAKSESQSDDTADVEAKEPSASTSADTMDVKENDTEATTQKDTDTDATKNPTLPEAKPDKADAVKVTAKDKTAKDSTSKATTTTKDKSESEKKRTGTKKGSKKALQAESTQLEKAHSEPTEVLSGSSPPAAKFDHDPAPSSTVAVAQKGEDTAPTSAANGPKNQNKDKDKDKDKDFAKGGERAFSVKATGKTLAKAKSSNNAATTSNNPQVIIKDARATKNNAEVRAQANEKMLLDGKRRRRRFEELERNYICEFPNCGRPYASEHSLNQHVRLKHAVRSPDRRRRGFAPGKGIPPVAMKGHAAAPAAVIGRPPLGRPLSRHVSHQPTSSAGRMLDDPRSMMRHDSRPYGGPQHNGPPPPEFIVTNGDGEQVAPSDKGADQETVVETHSSATKNTHGKRPADDKADKTTEASPTQKPKLAAEAQPPPGPGALKKEIPWTRAQVEGPDSSGPAPAPPHEGQGPPMNMRQRSHHPYDHDMGPNGKDRPVYEHGPPPPPHAGYYGMPPGADRGEWPPAPDYGRYPGLPPDTRGDPRYVPPASRESWVEGQGPPPPGAPDSRDYRPYGPPEGYPRYAGYPPGYYHDPREYYGAPRAHSPFTSDGRAPYMHGEYPPPPRSGYGYGMPPPSAHGPHAPHAEGYWADRRGYGPPAPRPEPSSYREM